MSMRNDDLLVLTGDEVASLMKGREPEVIAAVRSAYIAHRAGDSALPHSTFLRFPHDEENRIIALPAFLGDGQQVSGIKWVSSFPGNLRQGMSRASAVLVLNSCATGRPEALFEGSVISAKRTAASAALAARTLHPDPAPDNVGLIGNGVINFEIARFLRLLMPALKRFVLFDLDRARAESFGGAVKGALDPVEVEIAADVETLLAICPVISFATTAARPYLHDLSPCRTGSTLLHVSLRDLAPEVILSCDNVVDDPDHVCRAQTSVHLAQEVAGGRHFIRCSLADVLVRAQPARPRPQAITVFSPFGLGVLDLAVGKLVLELARAAEVGTRIESFFPPAALNAWPGRAPATRGEAPRVLAPPQPPAVRDELTT